MWASVVDGPSRSVGEMTIAREGWRALRWLIAARARSAVAGRGATTTSVSTLVRMRTRTDGWPPMCRARRGSPMARSSASSGTSGCSVWTAADVHTSDSFSTHSEMLRARTCQRLVGAVWRVGSVWMTGSVSAVTSQPAPAAAIVLDQVIGIAWTPRPGLVEAHLAVRAALSVPLVPGVVQRRDDAPRCLDLVGAGEQRRVAQHRVQQQRLVRLWRVVPERQAVGEVHVDAAHV